MSQESYQKEAKRWLQQARTDLEASTDSRTAGHYEWACFQAQQAAEKGMKAIWFHYSHDPWGDSLAPISHQSHHKRSSPRTDEEPAQRNAENQ